MQAEERKPMSAQFGVVDELIFTLEQIHEQVVASLTSDECVQEVGDVFLDLWTRYEIRSCNTQISNLLVIVEGA